MVFINGEEHTGQNAVAASSIWTSFWACGAESGDDQQILHGRWTMPDNSSAGAAHIKSRTPAVELVPGGPPHTTMWRRPHRGHIGQHQDDS